MRRRRGRWRSEEEWSVLGGAGGSGLGLYFYLRFLVLYCLVYLFCFLIKLSPQIQ